MTDDTTTRRMHPRTDLVELDDRYELRLDAPGADPQAMDLAYEKGTLEVSLPKADRSQASAGTDGARPAWFLRSSFGDLIAAEDVEARYERGVLVVVLPKARARQARRIDVSFN